ncbi:uncharacterized protein LOC131668037 [Phymastichus coffea]|uniref:uncharacterized protein LOC131668037 n=1 Tax=Phymastichus coffea TaxID=108790 RepID=UPI00273C6CB2|nr:uncharacterized protein LOC131668037 [Phymastichus coffea]
MRAVLLLFCGLLLAAYQGPTALAQHQNWFGDLFGNINRWTEGIQSNVHRMTQQIQHNVNEQVSRANQQVAEALKNVDKLNGTYVSAGDSSVIVTNSGGSSRKVQSGTDVNGNPYYVESENLVVGGILYHTDRVYNYTTKKLEEHRYTLNLSDPNAKPVYSDVTANPLL